MTIAAALLTALLFGGMMLYSFGFAAFLFSALPSELAGRTLRRAFPHFYVFVLVVAMLAGMALAPLDGLSALMMAGVALSTLPARQILMPAINAATDRGDTARFRALHALSVAITLAHIVAAGAVLIRLV